MSYWERLLGVEENSCWGFGIEKFKFVYQNFTAICKIPNFKFRTGTLGFHRKVTGRAMMPEIFHNRFTEFLSLKKYFLGKLNLGF